MDYIENITQKQKLDYLLSCFAEGNAAEYDVFNAIKLILEMLKDAKAYRYPIS